MNKGIIFLVLLMLFMVSNVSAILVQPGETVELPQLTSNLLYPDNVGTDRTLFYCTWRIDGQGVEAMPISTNKCPSAPINFTFEQNEEYLARIDAAFIHWDMNSSQWVLDSTQHVDTMHLSYTLDLPEPGNIFLDSILDIILNAVHNILCQIFPWLGFCGA